MDTKKRVVKATLIFLLFMIAFTIISRTADNLSVAKVTVNTLERQKISHDIKVQGQITTSKEIVITTVENQLIKSINVSEGQIVDEKTVLFTIDEEKLKSQIEQLQGSLSNKEEKQSIEKERAKEDYDRAVAQGDAMVSRAENAKNEAYYTYENYIANAGDEYDDSYASGLYSTFRELETAYEVSLEERETIILNAKRTLEDVEVNSDSTDKLADEITEQEQLNRLLELQKNNGQIQAPEKGIVNEIIGKVGSLTTEAGTVILGDLDSDLFAKAQVPATVSEYIGDKTKIKMESLRNDTEVITENLSINSMQLNHEQPEYYNISVNVPSGTYEVGTIVNITLQNQSYIYELCFPLDALRQDASNKYYVLVIKEKETVLGKELVAKKIAVNVIDKNDKWIAVDSESIPVDSEIVVETSKAIEDGSRIKRKIL